MEAIQAHPLRMVMATIEQLRQASRALAQWPAKYKFGTVTIIALLIAAHWEHPNGFLPNLNELIGALITTICAGLLICVAIMIEDYCETATWPWQHDEPVKKWRAWFWGVLDDEANDGSDTGIPSSAPLANEIEIAEKTLSSFRVPHQDRQSAADQVYRSPTTALLLRGLRPAADDPPTPTHKSGLLGESPMPLKFEHFSGDGFYKRNQALNAVARFSGSPASYMAVKSALSALKEEANGDHDKYMDVEAYDAPN